MGFVLPEKVRLDPAIYLWVVLVVDFIRFLNKTASYLMDP